jgi:mannose-1-phosphate guanylyltransferase
VSAFVEKPPAGQEPSNLINAGTYVLEPSVLDRIAGGGPVSIERDVFPALVADGTLYAMVDGGVYWLDAGTPETYLQAQLDVVGGRRAATGGVATRAVDPGAEVSSSARVDNSVVGPGVHIGDEAEVIDSVVFRGATIGAKARVCHSIVGAGASIGDAATLEALTVVGDGEVVAAGSSLKAARVPSADA